MQTTSLDKSKIKIFLLEGIHESALEAFRADGYTRIEHHPKTLGEAELLSSIGDACFVGIRSATRLTQRRRREVKRSMTPSTKPAFCRAALGWTAGGGCPYASRLCRTNWRNWRAERD